jgi:hypothetical protein
MHEACKRPVQHDRIRRGVRIRVELIGRFGCRVHEPAAERPDDAGLAAEAGKRLCDPLAARSLPVRARHADHPKLCGWPLVHLVRERTRDGAQMIGRQVRHTPCGIPFEPRSFPQYRRGTALDCGADEAPSVGARARIGQEDFTWRERAAVSSEADHPDPRLTEVFEDPANVVRCTRGHLIDRLPW